jgi:hypothetical protein
MTRNERFGGSEPVRNRGRGDRSEPVRFGGPPTGEAATEPLPALGPSSPPSAVLTEPATQTREKAMVWDTEADAEKPEWASDDEVRAVLEEAGIEPLSVDPTDKRLGGPDVRARDEVIANEADWCPMYDPGATTREEAMRGARRYDRWRRGGAAERHAERQGLPVPRKYDGGWPGQPGQPVAKQDRPDGSDPPNEDAPADR